MIKPKSMKHLFLILVVISLSGFGQTASANASRHFYFDNNNFEKRVNL